ncbi:MAG: hypothetical protein QXG38_00090 [Candidatus Hadarchaeales archaeon]
MNIMQCEKGAAVKGYLDGKLVVTPDVVLAEIARKYVRERIAEDEVRKRLYLSQE